MTDLLTPYLSFQQTLSRDQVELTVDDFDDVLVVRSFKPEDRLRTDLETALDFYQLDNGSRLPVRFVDVVNSNEFIEAVNANPTSMLVYDGHGTHDSDEIAQLCLADEDFNCWELEGKIRCPPIVFACGCDTHPAEGSHVTSGNGFLLAGARAVIASAMPIYSNRAAVFVARLLFNIHAYVKPVVVDNNMSIRWDRVFSSVQKMMYVSDLARALTRKL